MNVKTQVTLKVEKPLTLVTLDEVYNELKKQDVPETAKLTFYQPVKDTDVSFTVAARWEVEAE